MQALIQARLESAGVAVSRQEAEQLAVFLDLLLRWNRVQNLTAITEKINAGQGSIGQLMNDPTLAKNLNAVTSNFESLSNKLNQGQGTMGKLMNDAALYQRLDAVTTNLEQLTSKLNQGQGTMGQLVNDKQLYDNMNRTITEMQNLLADIRKDPKKFLNVRMSIF